MPRYELVEGTARKFWEIAVWWFALARARAARGLQTPRPHHALFATPLGTLPDPSSYDRAANPLIAEMAKL